MLFLQPAGLRGQVTQKHFFNWRTSEIQVLSFCDVVQTTQTKFKEFGLEQGKWELKEC